MNIFLWILQVLLAIHTAIGAVWKFSNTAAETMPSLGSIPDSAWLALAVVELLCSVGLLLPAINRQLGFLAPLAALVIAAEMLLFCGLHWQAGATDNSSIIYWLVMAALCGVIVYGRAIRKPG